MDEQSLIAISVGEKNEARRDVLTADLAEVIEKTDCVRAPKDEHSGDRLTAIEITYALVASGSMYVLATALRDFVRKQRVKLSIRRPSGESIDIDGSGAQLTDLSDLVGFLESTHRKTTKEDRKVTMSEERTEKLERSEKSKK
jgi:hypothetical protein